MSKEIAMETGCTYNWGELPIEIAAKIREHIELYDDYEAFSEVCSSWREAVKQFPSKYVNRKHTQLPWLMLADPDNSLYRRFYSLTKSGFLNIDLSPYLSPPHPPQARRYFSSRGWLISVSRNINKSTQGRVYFDITIFNPFSNNDTIHAPLFDLILEEYTEWEDDYLPAHFSKIVVSTCPNNAKDGHDFVVAVIFGNFRQVAYWRLGHGDTWVVPYSPVLNNILKDISFFRGELYATQYNYNQRRLIAFGDLKDHKQPREVAIFELPANMEGSDFDNYYLVESKYDDQSDQSHTSSLLVIHRCVVYVSSPQGNKYNTASFNVFKLNANNKIVEPVNSLGNQAIFVGFSSAFAVCANADDDRGCKADCIYYTDDTWELYWKNYLGGGSDMGIYSLPQGNTLPFYEGPSRFSLINPPTWIEIFRCNTKTRFF